MKAPLLSPTVEAKLAHVPQRLSKPSRRVLKEALDEYAARHDSEAVTRAVNRVADALDTRPDPAFTGAARSILERTEW